MIKDTVGARTGHPRSLRPLMRKNYNAGRIVLWPVQAVPGQAKYQALLPPEAAKLNVRSPVSRTNRICRKRFSQASALIVEMSNLTKPKIIWLKGILFVALGLLACSILIARNPEAISVLLLATAIWAFCRAYYFAFYVIERYVDPTYRFAGLFDFFRYAVLGKPADRRGGG